MKSLEGLSALALFGLIGTAIVLPTLAGIWLGIRIDRVAGTRFLGIVFMLLGLFGGLRTAYLLVMREVDRK